MYCAQVICCDDQGRAPPIAGEMPHDWLGEHGDYYEEVEIDHWANDAVLKSLEKNIRPKTDRTRCREMRKALLGYLGWEPFIE